MTYCTTGDFYYQVSSFGSYDVKILVERANHYEIALPDIIEHTFDNWGKEQIFDDSLATINYFFDSLLVLRIHQLQEYTRKALESLEDSLSEFDISEENSEEYKNTDILLERVTKLLKYLEEDSYDTIHLNACCSCFDSDMLDNHLFSVKNDDDIIDTLEKIGDFEL